MTPIQEFYLFEVERARDRDKGPHGYDSHCLCYGCEDLRADLRAAAEERLDFEADCDFDRQRDAINFPDGTWEE